MWLNWHVKYERCCCSKARGDGNADSNVQSTSLFAGYLIGGRSLTLPGRSSPTGSTVSSQSVDVTISSTHSLSLPNLQQHCTDTTSFINDAINTEWVSLMTSMNLGEVGDVEDSSESRSVNFIRIMMCCWNCHVNGSSVRSLQFVVSWRGCLMLYAIDLTVYLPQCSHLHHSELCQVTSDIGHVKWSFKHMYVVYAVSQACDAGDCKQLTSAVMSVSSWWLYC